MPMSYDSSDPSQIPVAGPLRSNYDPSLLPLIDVSDLAGAYVKSINSAGAVVVQLADGTESTFQLQPAMGQGANTVFLTTGVPDNANGEDGDIAFYRVNSLTIRAYQKVTGVWVRQWNFSGGAAVLLADLPAIPDRDPGRDPDSTGYVRRVGISGYSTITDDDIDMANPQKPLRTFYLGVRTANNNFAAADLTESVTGRDWPYIQIPGDGYVAYAVPKDSLFSGAFNNIFLSATGSDSDAAHPGYAADQSDIDIGGVTYRMIVGRTQLTGHTGSYIKATGPGVIQGDLVISQLSDWRGGNHGNTAIASTNTIPINNLGEDLASVIDYAGSAYLFFIIGEDTLEITGVTYDGTAIPVAEQAQPVTILGAEHRVWVSSQAYTPDQIDAHPFELTIARRSTTPSTYNRYAVVTENAVPTAADFMGPNARVSSHELILIPQSGWVDRRGYLHFALPEGQDAPTIAGQPGGINVIDDFRVRSRVQTVDINGDSMRTMSSISPVYQMTDRFSLFPWLIR